jgi:carbon starvation protein CstA
VPAPQRFALRDLVIAGIVIALWQVEFSTAGSEGALLDVFRVFLGLASVAAGALAHEWGHLLPSLASGATVHYPPGWFAKLLFDFDVERNTRAQFLWMNLGGYISVTLVLGVFALLLPFDRLAGQVALAGIALGTLAVFVIELPITIRVLRGERPPPALVTNYPGGDFPEPS